MEKLPDLFAHFVADLAFTVAAFFVFGFWNDLWDSCWFPVFIDGYHGDIARGGVADFAGFWVFGFYPDANLHRGFSYKVHAGFECEEFSYMNMFFKVNAVE